MCSSPVHGTGGQPGPLTSAGVHRGQAIRGGSHIPQPPGSGKLPVVPPLQLYQLLAVSDENKPLSLRELPLRPQGPSQLSVRIPLREAFSDPPGAAPGTFPARPDASVTTQFNVLCTCLCLPGAISCTRSPAPHTARLEQYMLNEHPVDESVWKPQ